MSEDSCELLYFYEQRNPARRFKRVRKEPEELPQALRYFKYANLNPRIAAFLGKQDPRNLIKRAKGAGQDEKEQNGDAKPSAAEPQINDSLGILGGFGDGLSQEARSLLPEIGQGGLSLVKMGAMDDSAGPSRLSFNEADDPQRYQFEETTFAAPNILRELSDTLTRFDHAFNEYVKRTKLHDEETTEKPRPADVLPSGLKHVLCQEWPELTSEAIFTTRSWQSHAYKSGYKYASTLASAGRQMTAAAAADKDSGAKGDLKGMVDLLDVKPTSKSMAAESSLALGSQHKKKGKGFEKDGVKAQLVKLEDRQSRYAANPTLSFNLSSKKAFDEGWVLNVPPDPDLEQANILEWATGRLQAAIKQKENEDDHAKKKGCDKPTIIRYYGDSRRDTLMKLYRKTNESEATPNRKPGSIPKIPQLSKLDNAQRERFMIQLPDASTTIFYPGNGEVAVMASAVPNRPGELYTNCYDNDEERTCLAVFTPYGKSCCYHKNGVPALVLSEAGGVLKSEDGSVTKKWNWPKYGKLRENVVYHLNKEMYVRVLSRDNVTLHFSCCRETHKIPVGTVVGSQSPSSLNIDSMGVLQAGMRYTSKSALEYNAAMRTSKDDKPRGRMRRHMLGFRKQSKKVNEIEELKKSMDDVGRFEFESQADRELQRLQHKSKFLVEDWMEHYRVAVGIGSPALRKMLEKAIVKNPKRNVRSAVERKPQEESMENLARESTRFQSFRSPSAPPKHMALVQAMGPLSEPELKPLELERRQTSAESPHVRIDESTNKELKTPSSDGKRAANRQFRSASSGGRQAAVPGQRSIVRSSMATTMSTHPSQTTVQDGGSVRPSQEKAWTPLTAACPVVTRLKIMYPDSTKVFACKCSKHRVPFLNDIEFDTFVREVVPQTQLVVVSVVNSLHEDSNPHSKMLENIYVSKNRNRIKPCVQCRHDQYRIFRYDLARAHIDTDRTKPLQLERHRVVPGMTLMYCGGKLLFADHIFNGYGNARKDFRKQIFKSRQDFYMGHFLPDDFRFSPSRGKSGPRAAWGGEIGGTGVLGKGKPGLLPGRQSVPAATRIGIAKPPSIAIERLAKSASYSSSSQSDLSTIVSQLRNQPKSKFDTAREFVQFSLSTKVYVQPPITQASPHRSPSSICQNKSSHSSGVDPVVSQMNNFLMMQAVK